jgi:hypothetical protein
LDEVPSPGNLVLVPIDSQLQLLNALLEQRKDDLGPLAHQVLTETQVKLNDKLNNLGDHLWVLAFLDQGPDHRHLMQLTRGLEKF